MTSAQYSYTNGKVHDFSVFSTQTCIYSNLSLKMHRSDAFKVITRDQASKNIARVLELDRSVVSPFLNAIPISARPVPGPVALDLIRCLPVVTVDRHVGVAHNSPAENLEAVVCLA